MPFKEFSEAAFEVPQCNTCKNKLKDLSCLAYEIIPDKILNNEIIHDRVLPDQIGTVVYEESDE